ncbi:MAG: 50S ribosomal protein L29 [Acidobacteria bacterium]|jgi:large subunit ribosomal protein L29|nr:50S ribosomal protein L29 [Acidobacteriota bacterium]
MKATELRELDADGLRVKVAEIEDELFRLRIRKAMGQLEKPVALRDARKNLARVKTVLREKAK